EAAKGKGRLDGSAAAFFAQVSEVVSAPWRLAANSDFAYAKTTGKRPPDLEENAKYLMALEALCIEDVQVHKLVMEVINLAKPLSDLTEEPLRSRVLAGMRR